MGHRKYIRKKTNLIEVEGYNLSIQIFSTVIVCALALIAFVPYMLDMEFHEDDPEIPYTTESDEKMVDITNAVMTSCSAMMGLEALLDSNTLYLPIKIAFPRFLMVFGVLLISLSYYCFDFECHEKLHYMVSMQFARGYVICGGLALKLVADAVATEKKPKWIAYVLAVVVFTADFMNHQWTAFYPDSFTVLIYKSCVSVCSFCYGLYFLYKVIHLSISSSRDKRGSYDVMSHLVVCVFYFGTISVKFSFRTDHWKRTTSTELACYNFVGLFAIILFFFTSSQIAQREFVMAKGQLINKKSFVRYVSHEIRTPLNTVYLGIQLLTTRLKKLIAACTSDEGALQIDAPILQDIVRDISSSCCISINILNDLLLIDKIEEGNLNLEIKEKNARSIIEPCINNFDIQAIYSNIDLLVDLQPINDITIRTDESKIVQVVRNIVSNALKFTPEGGEIQIRSSFVPDPLSPESQYMRRMSSDARICDISTPLPDIEASGKLRIEFYDTGPGISEENKSKLFNNVIQFDANALQSGGGSGLGLFISNAIMKRHAGGVIGVLPGGVEAVDCKCDGMDERKLVSSESAKSGCVFFIEIDGVQRSKVETVDVSNRKQLRSEPCKKDDEDSDIDSATFNEDLKKSGIVDEDDFFDKILIVEDSKFNRKMMTKALATCADNIVVVEDGLQAVQAVRDCLDNNIRHFDIIFMDNLMPNMNGIEATEIILHDLHFPNPIIAVTGNMLPDDVEDFMQAGVFAVLAKPLDLDKLGEVLRDIRKKRRSKDGSLI